MRLNFTDGYVETTFTVKGKPVTPASGDASQLTLWLGTVFLTGTGFAASFAGGKTHK